MHIQTKMKERRYSSLLTFERDVVKSVSLAVEYFLKREGGELLRNVGSREIEREDQIKWEEVRISPEISSFLELWVI